MRLRGAVEPSAKNIRDAVSAAVEWHFDSGLLRDRSGGGGMFEMIRSRDLKARRNVRTDATLLTGLLLTSAGMRFGNGEWLGAGRGLVDGMLESGVQFEGGWTDGFFRWYMDLGLCPTVWSSDTSRAGLAVINMFKLTGDRKYLESSKRLGEAFLRWFGGNDLVNGTFLVGTDMAEVRKKENLTDNPVFYGEMTSFLLQLHKLTGDARFRNLVMKYFRRISSVFPATKPFGFSDNFTYSRYLMTLVSIHAMGCVDVLPEIRRVLAFLRRTQDKSGGFRETPIRLIDHAEAGVGIGDGSDNIADLLYCNNFLLCALSTLRSLPDKRVVRLAGAAHERLLRFVLSSQITEPEKSLRGGWMRAFDMDGSEYHGLNKDKDWGAYCIMAGWMTGLMPLALLESLGAPPVFAVRD